MTEEKRDLLIHFDFSTDEFVFFSAPLSSTKAIREREFDGARVSLDEVQASPPDEAEKDFGGTVLHLLELGLEKNFGIRDYKKLSALAHEKYVDELIAEAGAGSAEAKYHLFIEYHSQALRGGSGSMLKLAEAMLHESAALGFADAEKMLKGDWQMMREVAVKRIQRKDK